jgi:hypothetical protein
LGDGIVCILLPNSAASFFYFSLLSWYAMNTNLWASGLISHYLHHFKIQLARYKLLTRCVNFSYHNFFIKLIICTFFFFTRSRLQSNNKAISNDNPKPSKQRGLYGGRAELLWAGPMDSVVSPALWFCSLEMDKSNTAEALESWTINSQLLLGNTFQECLPKIKTL